MSKHIDIDSFVPVRKHKRGSGRGETVIIINFYRSSPQGRISAELYRRLGRPGAVTFLANGTQVAVRPAHAQDGTSYRVQESGQFSATALVNALGIDRSKMRGSVSIHMEPTQTDAWVGDLSVKESEVAA